MSTSEKESQQSTSTLAASKSEELTKGAEPDFPDGGWRAWGVVFAAFLCNFLSFGYVTSYGVFQSYYASNLMTDKNPSDIAWIGSIQAMMLIFPATLGGALFDAGLFRITLFVASCCFVTFTFLVGECKEFWQFILCQGIASGFANGMIFGPVMIVIGHWWHKRQGLAFGVVLLGSSVGGVTIPIMVRRLIPQIGFPWTMRVLGFMFFGLLILPNLLLKTRLPTQRRKGFKAIFDVQIFTKNAQYSLYVFAGLLGYLGLYTIIGFLDAAAVSRGVQEDFAFYLIAIMNGVAAVSRFGSGWLADFWGPGNIQIPSLILSAAVTYGFPFAKDRGDFVAVGIFYGLTTGPIITSFFPRVYDMGPMEDLGKRVGMSMTCLSFGALAGAPISGALISKYGIEAAGYYAGTCLASGGLLVIVVRQMYLKGALKGKF